MRSRNSLMRERREAFRDARLIVIASEGKDTERIYFKALAKEYTNPRVHVHILERSVDEQNNSSPEHVLKQLNDYKSQYELEADDELWLVVDKDRQQVIKYVFLSNEVMKKSRPLKPDTTISKEQESQHFRLLLFAFHIRIFLTNVHIFAQIF